MPLTTRPIGRDAAFAWIREHHSHFPRPPAGWLFGVAVLDGERLCCVACFGRPARLLQNGTTGEITRVASDRTPHSSSKAIAAVSRAALALGYRRLISYTLEGEAGTSYRAAGWWSTGITRGGEWDRASRRRASAQDAGPKRRWEFGPDAQTAVWA